MFTFKNSQQIEKASHSWPVISAPRVHFPLETIADILCYQEAQLGLPGSKCTQPMYTVEKKGFRKFVNRLLGK
jgi:hypothetical protein